VQYNSTTKSQYLNVLNKYGTHFQKGITRGANLLQTIYTSSAYISMITEDERQKNATAEFYLSVSSSYAATYNVSADYLKNSAVDSLVQLGGAPQTPGQIDLQQWVASINRSNSAIVERNLVQISELLSSTYRSDYQGDIKKKKIAMEKALSEYFTVPGCTDPRALNWDKNALQNDGKCEYPCTSSDAVYDIISVGLGFNLLTQKLKAESLLEYSYTQN
jgi:hypothetical protein